MKLRKENQIINFSRIFSLYCKCSKIMEFAKSLVIQQILKCVWSIEITRKIWTVRHLIFFSLYHLVQSRLHPMEAAFVIEREKNKLRGFQITTTWDYNLKPGKVLFLMLNWNFTDWKPIFLQITLCGISFSTRTIPKKDHRR